MRCFTDIETAMTKTAPNETALVALVAPSDGDDGSWLHITPNANGTYAYGIDGIEAVTESNDRNMATAEIAKHAYGII